MRNHVRVLCGFLTFAWLVGCTAPQNRSRQVVHEPNASLNEDEPRRKLKARRSPPLQLRSVQLQIWGDEESNASSSEPPVTPLAEFHTVKSGAMMARLRTRLSGAQKFMPSFLELALLVVLAGVSLCVVLLFMMDGEHDQAMGDARSPTDVSHETKDNPDWNAGDPRQRQSVPASRGQTAGPPETATAPIGPGQRSPASASAGHPNPMPMSGTYAQEAPLPPGFRMAEPARPFLNPSQPSLPPSDPSLAPTSPSVASRSISPALPSLAPRREGEIHVGQRVEAEYRGDWYVATVKDLPISEGGAYCVECDFFPVLSQSFNVRPLLREDQAALSMWPKEDPIHQVSFSDGSWARAYRQAAGLDREALELLFRCNIISTQEFAYSRVSQEHIDECVWIGRHMLEDKSLEDWVALWQEAQQKFEDSVTACFSARTDARSDARSTPTATSNKHMPTSRSEVPLLDCRRAVTQGMADDDQEDPYTTRSSLAVSQFTSPTSEQRIEHLSQLLRRSAEAENASSSAGPPGQRILNPMILRCSEIMAAPPQEGVPSQTIPVLRSSSTATTVRAGAEPTLHPVAEWQAPMSTSEVDSISMPSVPSASVSPSMASISPSIPSISPSLPSKSPPEMTILPSAQGPMPSPISNTLPPRSQPAYPTLPPREGKPEAYMTSSGHAMFSAQGDPRAESMTMPSSAAAMAGPQSLNSTMATVVEDERMWRESLRQHGIDDTSSSIQGVLDNSVASMPLDDTMEIPPAYAAAAQSSSAASSAVVSRLTSAASSAHPVGEAQPKTGSFKVEPSLQTMQPPGSGEVLVASIPNPLGTPPKGGGGSAVHLSRLLQQSDIRDLIKERLSGISSPRENTREPRDDSATQQGPTTGSASSAQRAG